jgi:hypothetical protein
MHFVSSTFAPVSTRLFSEQTPLITEMDYELGDGTRHYVKWNQTRRRNTLFYALQTYTSTALVYTFRNQMRDITSREEETG